MATGKSRGSALSTCVSAFNPPADAAMAMSSKLATLAGPDQPGKALRLRYRKPGQPLRIRRIPHSGTKLLRTVLAYHSASRVERFQLRESKAVGESRMNK